MIRSSIPRRFRGWWIGWCLALGVAVPAQANRWPDWQVQRAITVADAHWPDSQCRGREQLHWVDDAGMQAVFVTPALLGATFQGDPSCQAWINWQRAVNIIGVCSTIEHEFGHLAGLGHSDGPNDVMNPYAVRPADDCAAAFRPQAWRYRARWTW